MVLGLFQTGAPLATLQCFMEASLEKGCDAVGPATSQPLLCPSPSSLHPSSWTHKQTPHHSWICEKMKIYFGNKLGILNPKNNPGASDSHKLVPRAETDPEQSNDLRVKAWGLLPPE